MGEGRYLYGIIKTNEKKSFGPCGINANEPRPCTQERGEEVYAIVHQDIACVVSNSPVQDYSSMLKETLGRFLVKHQTIIEKIMQDYTIIPMKFGTFVSDNDEVVQVLKRGYLKFKELLSTMDGKIELDVAATWSDLNSILKETGEEDKEIREFKAEVAKRPPEETLQDRIKIGMMIKDALDKRGEKEQAHIIDFLKKLTVDFQKHQLMDDKMILNCAFLLEKSKEPDFDIRLKELDKEYNQKVNFRCVGPLPPYSFATCQLKRVRFSQIEEAKRLLGLGDKVSLEQVKESYREFVQRSHPDKHPLEMTNDKLKIKNEELRIGSKQLEEEFEKITHAYKLLSSCYHGSNISSVDSKQKDFIVVEIIRP